MRLNVTSLCDVRLSEKESGLEFAGWLQTLGTRIVLITGETDREPREFADKHNMLLLTKPVSPKQLKAALNALVRHTENPQSKFSDNAS